jgi:hypothetical protein
LRSSNEDKALGIAMGEAWHICRKRVDTEGVIVRSSNYTLYGDMSARVMRVLSQFTPDLEIYSIDEAFSRPGRLRDVPRRAYARAAADGAALDRNSRVGRHRALPVPRTKLGACSSSPTRPPWPSRQASKPALPHCERSNGWSIPNGLLADPTLCSPTCPDTPTVSLLPTAGSSLSTASA